jgi:hypothetical protein
MAKLQSDFIVQYKTSWIENNNILYIQMELCLNNLSQIIDRKQNEFKRNLPCNPRCVATLVSS